MKWIASNLVVLSVLAGCGTAVTPAVSRGPISEVRAADAGGLLSRMQEPFAGVVEANYRKIEDELANKLLDRHPRVLVELADQKVKFEGELDWDRRWYRTGPRAIYLTRGGKRYELEKVHSYLVWEPAIGKKVTVYVHVVEHQDRIVPFLAGMRYY